MWAVDVSPIAAAYARYNADACGVGSLVHIAQGSWYDPVGHLAGRVGGIVSNPPYIPRQQMAGLQAEVGRHEPTLALDGGEGPGLDSLEVRTRCHLWGVYSQCPHKQRALGSHHAVPGCCLFVDAETHAGPGVLTVRGMQHRTACCCASVAHILQP